MKIAVESPEKLSDMDLKNIYITLLIHYPRGGEYPAPGPLKETLL